MFKVSMFLSLAYAELKVNFVEGFAVLWLRRFLLSRGAPRPYNVSVYMRMPFWLRRKILRLSN